MTTKALLLDAVFAADAASYQFKQAMTQLRAIAVNPETSPRLRGAAGALINNRVGYAIAFGDSPQPVTPASTLLDAAVACERLGVEEA